MTIGDTRMCMITSGVNNYLKDDDALQAYISKFVKHFQSTHLVTSAHKHSNGWLSSLTQDRMTLLDHLEARRKTEKREDFIRLHLKSQSQKLNSSVTQIPELSGTIKSVQFATEDSTVVPETQSFASIVSIHGDGRQRDRAATSC